MRKIFLTFIQVLFAIVVTAQADGWQTFYEKTSGRETPRYAETMAYCRRMADASREITLTSFGKSGQGRDLPLLILDRDGFSRPEDIRASGRTVVLIQACIHAGESEGKDAGLMLLRDLGILHSRPSLLDGVTVLFIPIFNTDGHERFGPFNRINQNGPREMGWRTTASNLNLNRDFLKADTPEMKAWLRMFNEWLPDFFIDSHTTDGADYQYVLTYLLEIYGDMDDHLTDWTKKVFIPRMEEHMNHGGYPVFPYVGFRNWHDPRSGLITEVAPPMLSQGYTALRNRPGLLIETHMLKPYARRVEATYACMLTTLEILAGEKQTIRRLVRDADKFVSGEGFLKTPFPLKYETRQDDSTMVDFLGVSYTSEKSDLSGGDWFKYGTTNETWKIPYFSTARPVLSVELPYGYIIPAEWGEVIERLKIHGIRMTLLPEEKTATVSTYRFINPAWQQNPYEGRHLMTHIEYEEISETRSFPTGSAVVELNQPAGRIIPHLLEPKGNGSLLSWGFFDAIFEQKEYGESYVIEKIAREIIRTDTAIEKEFREKMTSDTVFAHNPRLILNWFYNRSSWADSRKGVYPVGRIVSREELDKLRR